MTLLDVLAWSPTILAVVAVVTLVVPAFALGWFLAARRLDRATDDAVDELRAAQTTQDSNALRQLPPMVSAADALEHASRLGVSVAEAAEDLYRRRLRALLADRFAVRHRRPHEPAPTERTDR